MRCGQGLSNVPQFYHDTKKLRLLARSLVKPVQRLQMFVSELSRQPHYDVGVITRSIGEQLAKVVVISCFELVFYDHRSVLVTVRSQYIQRIDAYRCLSFL